MSRRHPLRPYPLTEPNPPRMVCGICKVNPVGIPRRRPRPAFVTCSPCYSALTTAYRNARAQGLPMEFVPMRSSRA